MESKRGGLGYKKRVTGLGHRWRGPRSLFTLGRWSGRCRNGTDSRDSEKVCPPIAVGFVHFVLTPLSIAVWALAEELWPTHLPCMGMR